MDALPIYMNHLAIIHDLGFSDVVDAVFTPPEDDTVYNFLFLSTQYALIDATRTVKGSTM